MSVRKSSAAIISVILAAAMLLGCISTAFAAGDGSISVGISFYDGGFVIPKETVEVKDGIAEEYGYTVSEKDHNGKDVDYITVFDAVVALHKAYYGDKFTAETCKNYLNNSDTMITKMFGKSATSSGFTVNDVMPTDGIYNETYHSYTGYSADAARIADGDKVVLFLYKDRSFYGDYYTQFDASEKTVTVGEKINFTVTGYSIAWYGFADKATIERNTIPMSNLDLNMIQYVDGKPVDKKVGTLNWRGMASYTVNEPGVYYFYASGSYIDEEEEEETPVIGNICTVTVKDLPADYSKVDAAVAAVPADLRIYTDESVAALNAVLKEVDRDLGRQDQAKVDAYADAVNAAVAALEVKKADYSKVDAAIAAVPADLSVYTDESVAALNEALANVDRNLTVLDQDTVDAYAEAINAAVAALETKAPEGKSFYIVKNFKISLKVNADEGKMVLDIDFVRHDICGNAPDKAENINLTLTVTWLSCVLRFFQSVIGG